MNDLKIASDSGIGEEKRKPLLSNQWHERLNSALSAQNSHWEGIATAIIVCGFAALVLAWVLFDAAGSAMPLVIGAITVCAGAGLGMWLGLMMLPGGTAVELLATVWRSFSRCGAFGLALFPILILLLIVGRSS